MSARIQWLPVVPQKPNVLPESIKFVLGPHYWDHDGSLASDPVLLTAKDVPYLQGVKDAGGEEVGRGAEELLAAIDKHGLIEVWISR